MECHSQAKWVKKKNEKSDEHDRLPFFAQGTNLQKSRNKMVSRLYMNNEESRGSLGGISISEESHGGPMMAMTKKMNFKWGD